MALTEAEVLTIEEKAREVRASIIRMLVAAKSGHTAGPLGMTDIFSTLYFHTLVHDPKNSDWEGRDRVILSNGHIVPVRYATMAHAGYFPVEEAETTLRKLGSRFQGHPEREKLPGMETTSGPLGSGVSQAAGMAYALRMDGKKNRIYCLTSDGEHQEGNTWEGIMFAGKYRLANLTQIIDRNFIQIEGNTEDIMPLEPLADKYRAFNWHVIEIDGHNIRQIHEAIEQAKAVADMPTLILANTIPGKGVKEIEGDYKWHGKPPTPEEGERFIKEILSV
ncbi:MAG TPA: transketolase [Candidatus Paceibacterota bacterium]|nr:transketolase [Candidatus Paceibacterota bacterium]